MKTSEVLNRAADLIEERGWTTGNRGMMVSGPHCLEGAIFAASGSEKTYTWGLPRIALSDPEEGSEVFAYLVASECPALVAVAAYLAIERGSRPWNFNDAPKCTAAEVIEVLRAAALVEAAKEIGVVVVAPREGGIAAPLAEVGVK